MKGVSSGSGGRANRVTSDNEERKLVSFGFRVSVQVTYLLDQKFMEAEGLRRLCCQGYVDRARKSACCLC